MAAIIGMQRANVNDAFKRARFNLVGTAPEQAQIFFAQIFNHDFLCFRQGKG